MRFALLLAFVLVAASATSVDEEDWEFYKQEFNKKYNSGREHHYRKGVFLKNRDEILKHNARFEAGLETYKTGVNQFTDMEKEEFESYASGLKIPENFDSKIKRNKVFKKSLTDSVLPDHIDWREEGAVTEVKNQGQCDSAWAFSTVGSIEGRHFLESGELVDLSVQNLIDCDRRKQNWGCEGGWAEDGFQFIIEEGGIATEDSYPYIEAIDLTHPPRQCKYNYTTVGATIKDFTYVGDSTFDLMAAVAHKGPISVAIHFGKDLQFYADGILTSDECFNARNLNHAVLLVGYGTEDGVDYWVMKNSWGPRWGEYGYFKIRRGFGHDCMITTKAMYAD